MSNIIETNKAVATHFIETFINNDDWDTDREVVAPNYVFHHPVGGTVQARATNLVDCDREWDGAEGAWRDSKRTFKY